MTDKEILVPQVANMKTEAELEEELSQEKLIYFINEKYQYASDERWQTEQKWLDATRNWRGEYSPAEKQQIALASSRNPNSSQYFVGITKTKVHAAYGQILEIMFSSNQFPIGIAPTPKPEGIAETVFLEDDGGPFSQALSGDVGFEGDGVDVPKGSTQDSLLGGMKSKLAGFVGTKNVVEGNSPSPELPELHPAQLAAAEMEKLMQDQLKENNAEFALRRVAFECVMLGTGILKGPFNATKTKHLWEKNEKTGELDHAPEEYITPQFVAVSPWNFYPDPDASNSEDMEFSIERHLVNRATLRSWKTQPNFDSKAIDRVLATDPSSVAEDWEQDIRDNDNQVNKRRYDVREFWGYIDEGMARDLDLSFDTVSELLVNAWVCNGELLKVIINPFLPARIPYLIVPYEEHNQQLWGIGVPENMSSSQSAMNGHWRMAIDNLKLAGNVVFEVNENFLVPGQDMSVYPGKIWRKQGGAPGQAVFATKYPDTSQSNINMFNKARELADEQTGIPSFMHGAGAVSRTASVASQMSQAAAVNLKTVIKNIDHYLLKPLGQNLFYWNMQFNSDSPEIRGDVNIVATGTQTFLQRDVKSQRLLSFLQVGGGNQATAPMVNYEYVLKEIAKTLDLDPDNVINSPSEQRRYAELIQLQGAQANGNQQGNSQPNSSPQGQGGGGGVQGVGGGVNPSDPTGTGNGNIGTGSVPQPGEAGFSGRS